MVKRGVLPPSDRISALRSVRYGAPAEAQRAILALRSTCLEDAPARREAHLPSPSI